MSGFFSKAYPMGLFYFFRPYLLGANLVGAAAFRMTCHAAISVTYTQFFIVKRAFQGQIEEFLTKSILNNVPG